MIGTNESLIVIFVIALVTYTIRAVPFLLFPDNKNRPKYILYLGEVLPLAIIGMLILYCLKNVSLTAFPFGIPEIISVGIVVILHLWKKNSLISICGGTVIYISLIQFVFV